MDSVVKIDKGLLKRIEEFIKKNKYLYSSKKQVVNLAIIEFLKSKSFKNSALFKKTFLKRSFGKKKRAASERKKKDKKRKKS